MGNKKRHKSSTLLKLEKIVLNWRVCYRSTLLLSTGRNVTKITKKLVTLAAKFIGLLERIDHGRCQRNEEQRRSLGVS